MKIINIVFHIYCHNDIFILEMLILLTFNIQIIIEMP